MSYTKPVGKKLNALLEKTRDAEKGFNKAAENADSSELKSYFTRKSQERSAFARQLEIEIGSFGQKPDNGGSTTGAMHRAWMDVKAFFSADNDESMLEETISGEKAAVNEYKDVLKETSLPSSTETLLTQQMNKISADLYTIKRLEDIA